MDPGLQNAASPGAGVCSLEDLSNDLLAAIARLLEPKELAALSVQNTRLKGIASDENLWREACKKKWPACRPEIDGLASWAAMFRCSPEMIGHASWAAMFRARHELPSQFCRSADEIVSTSQQAAAGASEAACISHTMNMIFCVGLAVSQQKTLKQSHEYQAVHKTVVWWIARHAADVLDWVYKAEGSLQEYDMWTNRFVNFEDIPPQRSAIAFFQEIASPLVDPSWDCLLKHALSYLDSTFHSIDAEAQGLEMPIPKGLPKSHWWYFLKGSSSRRTC